MPSLHRHTPTLSVLDARGLQVRSVAWCRSAPDAPAEARVHRARFDAAGHEVAQWDPRLWARKQYDPATPANLQNLYTLSGAVLSTASVDAGWRISLLGDAGHLMQSWDGRGSEQRNHYDALLRPTALFAKALNSDTLTCISRYSYGSVDADSALNNQCGRLIRHDDLAGTRHFPAFGLLGGVLEQQQCFLKALGPVNWPENIPERNDLLEPQGYSSRSTFNAVGETSEQADAQRNVQRFTQTIDGQLHELRLLQANIPTAKVLVSQIQHNAHGQITAQTAGNGVVSAFEYCPRDGRLMRLHAGALQDLNYIYDPVGNIVSLEDKAQVARHFAGQRIDPINRYTYDSLYQLIHATGWESGSANQGPAHLPDPQAVANYQQTYRYDAGGNLLELTHLGPQNHSRLLVADECSNRCLPVKGSRRPVADGFDENGNLLALDNGRSLTWDLHNQLTHVRPVQREGAEDDSEHYVYGAEGMRLRKIRISQTNARTVISETRYLPGLELRTNATGETVQVITAQAGRNTVQVLHGSSRPSKGVVNDLCRYTLADHLGSCSVELDSDAQIISRQTYHPFGTTAFSDMGNASQTTFRTLQYSGKELDATGLYYYGRRYYMPWLQRWVNTDPAGGVDGLNLFAMVGNNPIKFVDTQGLIKTDPEESVDIAEFEAAGTRRSADIVNAGTALKHYPKMSVAKLKKVQEEDYKINPDNRLSKKTVATLNAHAFAIIPTVGTMVMNHFNLEAPKGGPINYRGVDPDYTSVEFKEEHYLGFGSYRISSISDYLQHLSADYSAALSDPVHKRALTVQDLENNPLFSRSVIQSDELQSPVKEWVSKHIESSDGVIPVRAGGPGAHAEVRVLNTIVGLYPNNAERMLADTQLYTHRLPPNGDSWDFVGCYNCTGVIPAEVNVRTGRSQQSYASFNQAVRRQ
ncbi:RHS repeat domain-containing protein [Pseudomonas sp.]|uniref:RHS repeat domain-containing protein n=1 Tax=Pseudomonas sp. TaxID=306 RepID=UPI0026376ABF|nr:RHS repeat-associated core domain-containing protein [Pseudomonas sp.]